MDPYPETLNTGSGTLSPNKKYNIIKEKIIDRTTYMPLEHIFGNKCSTTSVACLSWILWTRVFFICPDEDFLLVPIWTYPKIVHKNQLMHYYS
jgi:hypothetical protein